MKRLLLLTQDPGERGGVASVCKLTTDLLDSLRVDYDHFYVATIGHPRISLRRRSFDKSLRRPSGDATALLALLPELHLLPLASGAIALAPLRHHWSSAFVVGASVFHGVVAEVISGPSLVWGATGLRDERSSQWASYRPAQRAVHLATLPLLERCERRVLRRASMVAGMSEHSASTYRGLGAAAPVVIPPPVRVAGRSFGGPEREAILTDGLVRLAYVGRVTDPRKRFAETLRLAESVAERVAPTISVELRATATTEELTEWPTPRNVALVALGYPDDAALQRVLATSHWLVLTSAQEGFGLVVGEAFAHGTPVATTPSGGPDGLLTDSRAGHLGSVEVLAAGIAEATSADRWHEFSLRADAYARGALSFGRVRELLAPALADVVGSAA